MKFRRYNLPKTLGLFFLLVIMLPFEKLHAQCNLTNTVLLYSCNDNGTPDDGTDDYFQIQFTAENPASSGTQYTLEVFGTTYGPYDYGTGDYVYNLPANGAPIVLTFRDVADTTCVATKTIKSLPCSGCNDMPVFINTNSPVCEGDGITIQETSGYPGSYSWTGPNGFTSNANWITIPNATSANAGTYVLTRTFFNGCVVVDSVEIVVNPAINSVDAGTYNSICEYAAPIQLTGSPGGGVFSGPGVSGNQFDPGSAGIGTHYIKYTVFDGCSGDSVWDFSPIVVLPTSNYPPAVNDVTVCQGQSTEIVPVFADPPPSLLFSEDFPEENAGVTGPGPVYTPPSNGQWSLSGNFSKLKNANRYFKVLNGQLTARNTKKKLCFETQTINITGQPNVSFSILISETGDHEPSDFVDVIYTVDGVATKIINWQGQGNNNHTLTGKNGANDADWGSTVVTVSGISGNTLSIKVCVKNNANQERIHLDDLVVTSQLPPKSNFYFFDADPLTPGANLLAGPVQSYDPGTTPYTSPETIWVAEGLPNGCLSPSTPVTVTVGEVPALSIVADTDICEGSDLVLSAFSSVDAGELTWYGPNGFGGIGASLVVPQVTPADAGTYTVTAGSSLPQCSVSQSIDINVLPTPGTPIVSDISVCEGQDVTIAPSIDGYSPTAYYEPFLEIGAGVTGPNGVYTPPSNGQWSLSGNFSKLTKSFRYFKVTYDGLTARCIKKKICFNSQPIDISNLVSPSIYIVLGEGQKLEPSDYLDVTYIVDGVPTKIINWQGYGNNNHTMVGAPGSNPDWPDNTLIEVHNLSGNTLEIEICAKNNAKWEKIPIETIEVVDDSPHQFMFYDADPSGGNANLLAGPAMTYTPTTTPQTSPQTVWVTAIGSNGCETPATPVVVTVNAIPNLTLQANDTMPCSGTSLQLSETGGQATVWNWSGPAGFSSTEQNPVLTDITPANSGTYYLTAGTSAACTATDSISIQVQPGSANPVCFGLISPTDGFLWDFSPGVYNFYDADPASGNANLIASQTSSLFIMPDDELWVTTGDPNGCESPANHITINDTSLLPNPMNIFLLTPFVGPADYGGVINNFNRLALLATGNLQITGYYSFDNALNYSQEDTIVLPVNLQNVGDTLPVYYWTGDSLCPTIGLSFWVYYPSFMVSSGTTPENASKASQKEGLLPLSGQDLNLNCYPNPFDDITYIVFDLPTEQKASLEIFDISGNRVFARNGIFPQGHNIIGVSRDQLGTSGVYLYRLKTTESTQVKKLILRK